MASLTVQFGKWLPDDDRNVNPGYPIMFMNSEAVPLDTIKNALYTGAAWRGVPTLVISGSALASAPRDGLTINLTDTDYTFAAASSHIYKIVGGLVTDVSGGSTFNTTAPWEFAQYGTCLIATDGIDPVQAFDTGTPSGSFAALLGSPPLAKHVGVVRDFVVLGNIQGATVYPYRVQWSGIANVESWPAPLTQAARAAQSGYQDNYAEYGQVQAITQGEQFGLVFQESGIVRMDYVGGDTVFSFFTFERRRGLVTPKAWAQIGNMVYFLSSDGFYATDGAQVNPIGYGKINRYFLANCPNLATVRAAVDLKNQCIWWAYSSTGGANDSLIIYNVQEDAWGQASAATVALFQHLLTAQATPGSFDSTSTLGVFTGAQTDVEIGTKTFRLNNDSRVLVESVQILCDCNALAAVAALVSDDDGVVYGSFTARNSRTRKVPARANGYAHAAKVQMTTPFTYAQGVRLGFQNLGRS